MRHAAVILTIAAISITIARADDALDQATAKAGRPVDLAAVQPEPPAHAVVHPGASGDVVGVGVNVAADQDERTHWQRHKAKYLWSAGAAAAGYVVYAYSQDRWPFRDSGGGNKQGSSTSGAIEADNGSAVIVVSGNEAPVYVRFEVGNESGGEE